MSWNRNWPTLWAKRPAYKGNASSKDILTIIDLVKTVVYNKYKVDLEPEVRIIGEE